MESGSRVKSVWSRAIAESDGNEAKAQSLYIKLRVSQVKQKNIEELAEKNRKIKQNQVNNDLAEFKQKYQRGYDIEKFDEDGDTPLVKAVLNGELEKVKYLLGLGANSKVEYMGTSLSGIAKKNNYKDIFDALESVKSVLD